ncbi:MAG: cytochrome c2 [Planctomycetota bacterium]|jgi:cytochrome c2
MADRGDTHYKVSTLNSWFLFSSVFLLVATVWMVIDDWNAPWKKYQAEFRTIEEAQTRDAIESDEMMAQAEAAAEVEGRLSAAQERLDSRSSELAAAKDALHKANGVLFDVDEAGKAAKQDLSWERYLIEEHRNHEGDPEYGVERLAGFELVYSNLEKDKFIELQNVEVLQAAFDAIGAEVLELEGEKKTARSGLALLEKKLGGLAPDDGAGKLANILRDFPGIDFVDPRNKVKKQVPANLTFELNFTKGQRIDMCQTCHEAIDRSGYTSDLVVDGEEVGHPFLTHPNLDLYLGSTSPHPIAEVGCTICHRGSGLALDFIRADHRPVPGAQMEDWQGEHHWHKQHHWDYPMLDANFTEASCVQCHKGSMELIAEDAPRLSKGYRLFEEKGCYACHKVEWFPTKRRPGPTLQNLQAKLDKTWVDSWVSQPTNFRPSTKMPRLFHLSNFKPEQEITVSEWGEGRSMLGQEWNESAVASITAYLWKAAPKVASSSIPVQGNAETGRETFRLAGCLACHNMAGYPGQNLKTADLAFELNGENEHGPNLRGVATKLDRDWLYNWIKDPEAYWPETKMPNLELSDQEAADITAYMMDDPDGIFRDVPDVWELAEAPYDAEVLREMARWFFSRQGRDELDRRFAGENEDHRWDREEDLLLAIGEKQIGHYGCFSCHSIPGFEETNPIGTELTNWGSKTVDKLAWEFRAKILAHDNGWKLEQREEFKHYRENWIGEKLANPRIFDEEKSKNPLERLRMPAFGLNNDEILSISNFVVGLVEDEVQAAEMKETPAQAAMDYGMRIVRQQNCMACHVVEPGRVIFHGEDGELHDIAAEPVIFDDMTTPPAMNSLDQFQQYIASYEEEFEELEDVGFRLLEVEPSLGKLPGETVFVTKDQLVDIIPAQGGDFVSVVTDYYINGIEMHDPTAEEPDYTWTAGEDGGVTDVDGTQRVYYEEQSYDKIRWTFAPPVLIDEGTKLQRNWFYAFLLDPFTLRRQLRVHMPNFNISNDDAAAVADYFAYKGAKEAPARFARALRLASGLTPNASMEGRGLPWPEVTSQSSGTEIVSTAEFGLEASLTEKAVKAIEAGYAPTIKASFFRDELYAEKIEFTKSSAVNPSYEAIVQRSPAHQSMAARGVAIGELGVKCFECHWMNGNGPSQLDAPIAWAPDLSMVRERLRPDWVRDWLWNPSLIYPGTAMAANFITEEPVYQEQYPDSENRDQIEAVLDWLYTLDIEAAKN